MKKKESIFRFKRFEVSHGRSALKVGVDGVLTGLWCRDDRQSEIREILDAGCGCGVISLICAQRFPSAHVTGIDIDLPSVCEAFINFRNSPWKNRLSAELGDFSDYIECTDNQIYTSRNRKFDLIISNPPFYDAGIEPVSSREIARHSGSLSPYTLIVNAKSILNVTGRLCMIIPADDEEGIVRLAADEGYIVKRLCRVRGNRNAKVKRVLIELELSRSDARIIVEELILEESRSCPTPEYRKLGKDFYLKF